MPSPVAEPAARSWRSAPYAPLLAGAVLGMALLAGLGGSTVGAPPAGAAMAPAIVPDAGRRTVRHLEGGIVRRILVQNGSTVVAGQGLLEFDATVARAGHAALLAEVRALDATEARLLAEQAGDRTVTFPPDLLAVAAVDPLMARTLAGEQDALARRVAAATDERAGLQRRVRQIADEIRELDAHTARGQRQLEPIAEEVDGRSTMASDRLGPQLWFLTRNRAAIAHARRALAEAEGQMQALVDRQAARVASELGEVRARRAPIEERLRTSADRLARSMVRAPIAGTVSRLRIRAPGGMIEPGGPLLDIVPIEATRVPVGVGRLSPVRPRAAADDG